MIARSSTLLACLFTLGSAATAQLYETDFTTLDGWTVTTGCASGYTWAADATPSTHCAGPFVSAPHSLNFNDGVNIGGLGAHGGAAYTCGWATSPVIDLGAAQGTPHLRFQFSYEHEMGCAWDALVVSVRPAGTPIGSTTFHYQECLSASLVSCQWHSIDIPLEASWGPVEIEFHFDVLDDWWNQGAGPFIDDLEVADLCEGGISLQCDGDPQIGGGPGADLSVTGSISVAANDLSFQGAQFPYHTFSTLFAGPDPAVIPLGNGTRCVGTAISYRLSVAPTRDFGLPIWNVDLAGAPPAGLTVVPGSTWYFQAIYRDGVGFNFSDALRLQFCN